LSCCCVPVLSVVLIMTLMSAVCSLLLGAFAICACRFCKTKRRDVEKPPAAAPVGSVTSLHISQSTPDLATSGNGTLTLDDEKIGRSHYKTVIKQVTLPTLTQQHLAFRRQLCVPPSDVAFTIQRMRYDSQGSDVGVIEPDLYRHSAREGGGIATAPENVKTCGSLQFMLRYDDKADYLVIRVISARNLPAKDFSGTSDPYVKVYLLPDRKRKHQTKV